MNKNNTDDDFSGVLLSLVYKRLFCYERENDKFKKLFRTRSYID